jgi:hypothetical protein
LNRARTWPTGIHYGAAFVALTGIGCATIAGLGEDFEHAPVCNPIVPPTAPKVTNAGDDVEFIIAIRTIDLDEGDDTPRFGYDLDGKCSCTLDGQSCKRPKFVDPKKETCDDERGVDNGGGIALARINALAAGAISSVVVNEAATKGIWSQLIRVSKYSGTPNDDRVTVAVYETPGMTAPAWNGTDAWPISNTSVGSSGTVDEPLTVDDAAFVVDGVLVAHFPTSRIFLRAESVSLALDLISTTMTARVVAGADGKFRLTEGTYASKWTHSAMFNALTDFRYGPMLSDKFCRGDIVYLQVKGMFCSATDILEAAGPNDGSEFCNAISLGMRFDTEPALLGPIAPPIPPPTDACDPGFDPSTDSCGSPI